MDFSPLQTQRIKINEKKESLIDALLDNFNGAKSNQILRLTGT